MLQFMSNQPIKVELPLPVNYNQQYLNVKVVTLLQFLIAVLTFIVYFQQIYPVDLVRPALTFAATSVSVIVYAIGLVGRRQLRKKDPAVLKKILLNPISISLLSLGFCIFFKVRYYSILYSVPSLGITLILLKNMTKGLLFTEILSSFAFIAMNAFFGLTLLREEDVISLQRSWTTALGMLSLVGFELQIIYDLWQEHKKRNYNFNYSNYKIFLFNKIITTSFTINCFFYTLKHLLQSFFFRALLLGTLIYDCLLTFILVHFSQELTLFITCPQFTQWEGLYRIHYSEYIEVYDRRVEAREQPWEPEICKLCDQIATIVNLPCGHLSICKTCHKRFEEKEFRYCVICSERTTRTKQLRLGIEKVKFGYQRKFFIEKKLWKNQYLID